MSFSIVADVGAHEHIVRFSDGTYGGYMDEDSTVWPGATFAFTSPVGENELADGYTVEFDYAIAIGTPAEIGFAAGIAAATYAQAHPGTRFGSDISFNAPDGKVWFKAT